MVHWKLCSKVLHQSGFSSWFSFSRLSNVGILGSFLFSLQTCFDALLGAGITSYGLNARVRVDLVWALVSPARSWYRHLSVKPGPGLDPPVRQNITEVFT